MKMNLFYIGSMNTTNAHPSAQNDGGYSVVLLSKSACETTRTVTKEVERLKTAGGTKRGGVSPTVHILRGLFTICTSLQYKY